MKKIVIINHYGITPDKPGATRHYDMAKYFSRKNEYNVEFWMCGYNHHIGKNDADLNGVKIQEEYWHDNLKLVKIKSSRYRNSNIMRQLNIMIFDLLTAFKILFSRDIEYVILSVPPISIFNVLVVKLKKIKLITDVEDLWPLFLKNKLAINYMNFCADFTYNHSNGIEAVSEGMRSYVLQRLRKQTKTSLLSPLGVDLEIYRKDKLTQIDITNKMWQKKIKIMYIGAHGKANGLTQVIDVANALSKEISEIAFIFIGDGDQKNDLIEYARSNKVSNVYFEDSIPGDLVPSYLNLADICLTNLQKVESFKLVRPNKLFQYMAAAKPIICGIWGESKSIIEESRAGIYVDMSNTDEAVKKIKEFISSEYTSNGLLGYDYIKKYGNRNIIFENLYNWLIEV